MPSAGPVLIVDDEPNLVTTLAIILDGNGFEVVTSSGVDEALALIVQRPFSILLADLNMPGDGSTVIAAMHRQQPAAAIIVITGYIGPNDIPPAVRALATEVMFKPIEIPLLLSTMRRLCNAD